MQFDMNQAWREASGMVSANSQVLGIVAGVFFFLPSLATAIFAPMPEPAAGMAGEEAMAFMSAYYSEALPWIIGMGIAQAVGVLALLALLTDRSRPTVGEALKAGAFSLPSYIASQLLVGLAFVAIIALGAATGSVALAAVLFPVGFAGMVYAMTKTSLVAPVIVIDGVRNPIAAIGRSWNLTKGNSLRPFGFYFLVFLAFIVVMILVSMLIGMVTMLALGANMAATIVNGAISGALGAAMVVYFVSIIAAAHRQLSGPSAEAISATFE